MEGGSKLHKDAQKLLRKGSAEEALRILVELLSHVDTPHPTYDAWIADAERAAARLPDPRLVAYLALYRRDLTAARELLPRDRFPVELAHVLALHEGREAELFEAAVLFEANSRKVLAARTHAACGKLAGAVRCYRQLLDDDKLGTYEQALVHFQLALTLHRIDAHDASSRRHAAQAQGLLEALADSHEEAGDLERALDCYRLYIRLGQSLRSFENIVEGYTSCLRLLKDERRTLDVLRHYEELLRSCAEYGEHHLLAEKCREAATHLERQHLDWSLQYRRRSAEALSRAFAHNEERGGPPQLGESTLLQAAAAFNALDDFVAVGRTFSTLAGLLAHVPGEESRAAHYHALAERYPKAAAPDENSDSDDDRPLPQPLPSYVQSEQPQPPIWDLDLVEWQAAGDASAVCLSLVGDRGRPQLTRRYALLVLLHLGLAQLPQKKAEPVLERRRQLIDALCGLHCYEALRPLERLFDEAAPVSASRPIGAAKVDRDAAASLANPTPEILTRRAIIQALPRLPFRRTLALIERGLRDPDLGVYTASVEALSGAYFPEAVSGLLRLYRAAATNAQPVLEVQRSILRSLGKSRDPRARELFVDVARHDREPLRSDALGLLQVLDLEAAATRPG